MAYQNNQKQRAILLDTCSFLPYDGDHIMKAIKGQGRIPTQITPEYVQSHINALSKAEQIPNALIIPEVRKELRYGLDDLNSSLQFMKRNPAREQNLQNMVNSGRWGRDSKRNKVAKMQKRRDTLAERFEDGNSGETYDLIQTYARKLHSVLHSVDHQADPRESLRGGAKHIYNVALGYANKTHLVQQDIRDQTLNGNFELKLGDHLNTDNQLIATSIGLSVDKPTFLLTTDSRLAYNLGRIQKALKRKGEILRQQRKRRVIPQHSANALDLEKFLELEKMELD